MREIFFADEKIKEAFEKLKSGTTEERKLYEWLMRAFNDIKEGYGGIQIPNRLIPKEYIKKYGINNLLKYDLPDAWRLLYSIANDDNIQVIAVILEWMDHKNYERRFKY